MTDGDVPPFGSLQFHTRFFPRLLWGRLHGPQEHLRFAPLLEMHVALAVCVIFLVSGVPFLRAQLFAVGWVLVALGGAGLVGLLVHSVAGRHGVPPTFDDFFTGFFYFFVTLGISVGLLAGTVNHSLLFGLAVGAGGIVAGYLVGILAGLWAQYLGWIAGALSGLLVVATLGLLFTDLIFLSIALFA